MQFTFILDNIDVAAQQFWQVVGNHKVFAFHGNMGAGKTTFVKALCAAKNVVDTVGSPTYSIVNEYKTTDNQAVFHIDLYRIKTEEEAIAAGVEECLYSNNICFVEWPQLAPSLLPLHTVNIFITPIDDQTRSIEIEKL